MGHHKCCKKVKGGCESKPITQELVYRAGGNFIISDPGSYTLKEDIKGTISIRTSNVCLDLCCHTLNANGASVGIWVGEAITEQISQTLRPQLHERGINSTRLLKKKKQFLLVGNDEQEDEEKTTTKVKSLSSKLVKATATVAAVHHVRISNGSVVGSSIAGIVLNTISDVEISDLTMCGNVTSIAVTSSTAVDIKNVDFLGKDGDERALFFEVSDSLSVSNCSVSNYLSTVGALIEFNTCNLVDVKDVNVTNNVKSAIVDNHPFQASNALVFVGGVGVIEDGYVGCSGVTFTNVKVNNNIIRNSNLPAEETFQTFEAIFFSYSDSCRLINCETCGNVDELGSVTINDTEDFMLLLALCSNCTVIGHKSNNNRCEEKILYFEGITLFECQSIILDQCQANSNVVNELVVDDAFASLFWPITIASYFGILTSANIQLKNSQANENILVSSGRGRISWQFYGNFFPILVEDSLSSIVDNCQANRNTILDNLPYSYASGIIVAGGDSIQILNCTANSNTGGQFSNGINLYTTGERTTVVSNCICFENDTAGLVLGNLAFSAPDNEDAPGFSITNVVIQGCKFVKNGLKNQAFGSNIYFASPPSSGNVFHDIVIKDCDLLSPPNLLTTFTSYGILYNGSSILSGVVVDNCKIEQSLYLAQGISVKNTKKLVIQNCDLIYTPIAQLGVTINTTIPSTFPAAFSVNGPRNLYPITAVGKYAGSVAMPTNACDTPLVSLAGNIAIVVRADTPCGSVTITNNTQAAGAVATIILAVGPVPQSGNSTQPSVVIPIQFVSAFQLALAAAPPGTTISIGVFNLQTSSGILLDNCENSKIINTEVLGYKQNGIELSPTCSNCLVQDSHALGNGGVGFLDVTPNNNAWLGNKAQNNGTNYSGVALPNIAPFSKSGVPAPPTSATINVEIVP